MAKIIFSLRRNLKVVPTNCQPLNAGVYRAISRSKQEFSETAMLLREH